MTSQCLSGISLLNDIIDDLKDNNKFNIDNRKQ